MALALVAAAQEAGIRIALLDTAYLAARVRGRPAASRAIALLRHRCGRLGCSEPRNCAEMTAPSSAPPSTPSARSRVSTYPRSPGSRPDAPLHVHLSEQVAENEDCLAAYGVTPTQLLADAGALGPRTSAVHATHLTDDGRPAARHQRHVRLLLPDHRARPRRRHRPVPAAARGGQPADARQRQPRRHRPVRGDARGRARRAAGHPAPRPLDRGRAAGRGHVRRPRLARVPRRRPDRGRGPCRPRRPRHRHRPHRRHRRRRGDRGLRGHRRGRRPGDGRRPLARHPRRAARGRSRAGRRHRQDVGR